MKDILAGTVAGFAQVAAGEKIRGQPKTGLVDAGALRRVKDEVMITIVVDELFTGSYSREPQASRTAVQLVCSLSCLTILV